MKLYRTNRGIIAENQAQYLQITDNWDELINRSDLIAYLQEYFSNQKTPIDVGHIIDQELLPPIVSQEVWGAGVTYLRSREARMEEAKDAGGGDFYDKVYAAERPEIFFKNLAHRTAGSGQKVRIRKDSGWNVPEPEFTLFINSAGKIAGYTIGNDMSSRDIEGQNPLYLPQAKSYDFSAALGPCIFLSESPIDMDTEIRLEIIRNGVKSFSGEIQLNQMKRSLDELVEYLYCECSFPYGCFLMTGTGIIPPNDFTLESGDEIRISVDPIGVLVNTVE
jgi:2-dehydro-3-deoxy-D-arabinonate dehydratase